MKNKKLINISFCLFLLLALLLPLFLGGINLFPHTNALDENQNNEFFQVRLYDTSNAELTAERVAPFADETGTIDDAFVYNIAYLKEVHLDFDFTKLSNDQKDQIGLVDNAYKLTITIEYMQGYTDSTWTTANVQTRTLTRTLAAGNSYTKFNDEILTMQTFGSWGIYRFKMALNNFTAVSDFFVIEPTLEVNKKPQVEIYDEGLHTYKFNLDEVTADAYKNIDPTTLKWYAYGIASDGSTYALLAEDTQLSGFAGCAYLYEDIERSGLEFTFEKPEFASTWQVWCEYRYHNGTSTLESNKVEFKVGPPTRPFPYVWVIVGACILFLAVTTLAVGIKAKKDKVY